MSDKIDEKTKVMEKTITEITKKYGSGAIVRLGDAPC